MKLLGKVLITALKDKKSFHEDLKKNLHFKQLQWNYINNQKQKLKKNIRLACQFPNGWLGLCHKHYQNLQLLCIYFLCCSKERRVVENIKSGVATLKILTIMQKL